MQNCRRWRCVIPRIAASSSCAAQLFQRPPRRLAQPLVRGLGPFFQPGRKPAQPAVAHRDGHIAPEPQKSRPAHRRAVELRSNSASSIAASHSSAGFTSSVRASNSGSAAERRFAIPRANILADVAAEDLPPHALHQLRRNRLRGARWSGRRCIAPHPSGKAQSARRSGRPPGSAGSFRSDPAAAPRALFPLRSRAKSAAPPEIQTTPASDESGRCSCPSSPVRPPSASARSTTGPVST